MKNTFSVLLLLIAFTTQAQVACLPGSLSSGIIAFYPFSSSSINDFSGHARNLSNPTTASSTTDRFGNANCAYHFVKTAGDYLHIPAASATFLDGITTGPFSISLWFQGIGSIDGSLEVLVGRGTPGGSGHCPDTWQQWSVGLYDCRQPVSGFERRSLWSAWTGSSGCSGIESHFTGSWHHLALTYTGTTRNLYIDGVLYSAVGDTCGPVTMDIGDLVLGNNYNGDLDDILIYNRALSATEVSALNGAAACCSSTTISLAVPATEPKLSTALKVFPNPADNLISVSSNGSMIRSVSVYNTTGAECGTYSFDSKDVSIDIKALAPGMYFMKVTTDAETTIEKLIRK